MRRMMLAAACCLAPVVAGAGEPLILGSGGPVSASKSIVDRAPPCLSAWHETRPNAHLHAPLFYSLSVNAPMQKATALTADGKLLGVVRRGHTRQWVCSKPATGVVQ